ncbi:MAG TPA: PH domain-containing protein [Phycisphaerae bacterium]|nr:PH domain-containing protein [Phycisphaerae bacterium]
MRCTACNQPVESDSKFCKFCGAPQVQGAVAATAPAAAAAPAVAPAADKTPNPYRDPAYEKDVWAGRPAWRAAYGSWFLWAVLSLVVLYAAHRFEWSDGIHKAIWLLIALGALYVFVRQAMISMGQRYRITTQRLFIERGMLSRVTDQMELVRVDDVRVRQGIIDRMVNTGDIEVIGSDKTDVDTHLEDVSSPNDVAEAIRRNVRAARGRGAYFVENV